MIDENKTKPEGDFFLGCLGLICVVGIVGAFVLACIALMWRVIRWGFGF